MIKRQVLSFKNALTGLIWVFRTQANFRVHLFMSAVAVAGSFFFNLSGFEFLTVLTLIFVGLSIETINTAIEEAIDAIHKEHSQEIKIAKDVSAAAMLIFSLGAALIAVYIFGPKVLILFK